VVEMQAAWKDWIAAGSPSSGALEGMIVGWKVLISGLGAAVLGGVTFLF
jgi:hypothetical protein